MRKFLLFFFIILLTVTIWAGWQVASRKIVVEQSTQFIAKDTTPDELTQRKGAIIDELVFTLERDVGKVTGLIESGQYHVFTQGITNSTIFSRLRDSLKSDYELAYGATVELTLNPAKFSNDKLNPFHVTEIREALNWLVDRNHVAAEIYGGLAAARYLPLNTTFPDYARLADVARALELRYQHNPELAKDIITKHMLTLGAKLTNSRWTYQNKLVEITVLIRSDDVRKRVGDYIANLLEDIGFTVKRLYRTAEESSRIWVAGDPAAGEWNIYTGSWVSTVINRDLSGNFSFYDTPRGRPYPLWQAYKPTPELDQIADRLERREYKSWQERQQMMTRALELSMQMSTRIWLLDQISATPRSSQISVASDLAGGIIGSRLFPYTLRFNNKVGGRVVFATPNLLVEPWNHIEGSNWLFDTMVTRALDDSALLPDPFTGLYLPQRIESAKVTVEKGVLVTKTHNWVDLSEQKQIKVPDDVWIDWDHKHARFISVKEKHPEGITARTHTRINYEQEYLQRRWHDGSKISIADLLIGWIISFERANKESPFFDEGYVPSFEIFTRHFKGWQIVSEQPLIIDVYSDQIFPDAETIVALRAPEPIPWHAVTLGLRAEQAGRLAFSTYKADQLRVDWLNMIAGPSLNILLEYLRTSQEDNYLPFKQLLSGYISPDEIKVRYSNLDKWYQKYKHFWVGDGPLYLHAVYPVERVVILRRFADFPDPANKWLGFSKPAIPELVIEGPIVVNYGESADFKLKIMFEGDIFPSDQIDQIQYLLFEGTGKMRSKGIVNRDDSGEWQITIPASDIAKFGIGTNSLEVALTSKQVALPIFSSHSFTTLPKAASLADTPSGAKL